MQDSNLLHLSNRTQLYLPSQDPKELAIEILKKDWNCVERYPNRTSLIVTNKKGKDCKGAQFVKDAMELLAKAGGSMCFGGNGRYLGLETGKMDRDKINLVECFYKSSEAQLAALPEVSRFLKGMQQSQGEESIGMKFNTNFFLLY